MTQDRCAFAVFPAWQAFSIPSTLPLLHWDGNLPRPLFLGGNRKSLMKLYPAMAGGEALKSRVTPYTIRAQGHDLLKRIDNRAHPSLSHLPADVVPDSGPAHLLESCPPGSGAPGLLHLEYPRRLKAIA